MLRDQSVFLSTTSADLEPARQEAARVLTSLGFRVLLADNGPNRLRNMNARIGECDVFLQLVGLRYGEDSPSGAAEFGRVSLGQHESLHAEKMGRETIYLLLDETFPGDPIASEHQELSKMQHWYRQHLLSSSQCHCAGHLHEVESIIRSLPDVPCAPPGTAQTLLTNAALIVVSLCAIAWSTARLWAYSTDRGGRPTELLPLPDLGGAAENARAEDVMRSRRMVQSIVDECVIWRSSAPPNAPEDVIEAAIARLCADRPQYIPVWRDVLRDYREQINRRGNSASDYEQALAHFVAKRFDQAAEKAGRSIAIERERRSPLASTLRDDQSQALLLAGHAFYMMRKFDQAISTYQQRASLFDRKSDPLPHAWALNWVANGLCEADRYEDAERVQRDVMNLREKNLPPDAPALITAINDTAAILLKLGRYAEAESLIRRSLAVAERNVSQNPQALARRLEKLTEVLIATERPAEAEAALRRALLIRVQKPSENAVSLADDLRTLARLLYKSGRYAEAEPLFREDLPLMEKILGPNHVVVAHALNELALALQKNGNATEAVPLLRRALRIMEQKQGPAHADTAMVHLNLALILIFNLKFDEALEHSQSAASIMQKYAATTGHEHPRSALVNGFYFMLQHAGTMDEEEFKTCADAMMRGELLPVSPLAQ